MISARSLLRALELCVLLFLITTGTITRAAAHASLISSEPPDGAVLSTAPPSVQLTFNESVTMTVARLLSPHGRSVDLNPRDTPTGSHRIPLPPGLGEGTHVLSWRVVSDDGHPVGGAIVFSIGRESAAPPAQIDSSWSVRALLWLSRAASAVGAAFGVGGVAFSQLLVGSRRLPRSAERVIVGSLIAGALGAAGSVGLQGLDLQGASLDRIADPAAWRAGLFTTGFGLAAIAMLLAFLLAFGARRSGGTLAAQALAAWALGLIGIAFASSGHAATAPPNWLTRPAIFLHALALTLWIGALPPLIALARVRGSALDAPLRRFSDAIPFVLVILFASGLTLAIIQLGSVGALWRTEYGLVLCMKLGLLLAVLSLAAANRLTFSPGALDGVAAARRRLVRSIEWETALLFGVLAIAGLWRFTPPPRSAPGIERAIETAYVRITAGELTGRLIARPAKVGAVFLSVDQLRWRNSGFQPLSVSFTLEKPSFGLGPFRREAMRATNGEFSPTSFYLPMDGFWIVRIDILISEFQTVSITEMISVQP